MLDIQNASNKQEYDLVNTFSVQYFDWCFCCSVPGIILSHRVPNQGSGGVTLWQCYFTGWRGEGGPPWHWTHHNTVSSELVTPNNNNNRTRLNTREREKTHNIDTPVLSSLQLHIDFFIPGDWSATISGHHRQGQLVSSNDFRLSLNQISTERPQDKSRVPS